MFITSVLGGLLDYARTPYLLLAPRLRSGFVRLLSGVFDSDRDEQKYTLLKM